MDDVREAVRRWRANGEQIAIATVVDTRRSAPRPVGSRLAVSESGELIGSVSGGCVESDVYEHAREVIRTGERKELTYGIADETAWEIGLPCGGEIDVVVERLEGELPEEDVQPTKLIVVGATDVAEALCRAAKLVGWQTSVLDARAKLATAERIPSADELRVGPPEEAVGEADEDTAVVVLTHEERFDVPALEQALATDAFYVGALGSRKTQERRRARLREAGVSEARLERINGPCGLDLGAESAPEMAVSILAEMLAARGDRSGRPLKETKGAIHARASA